MLQEKYFVGANGVQICYRTNGRQTEKKCLVFLHGITGNLTAWKREWEYFDKKGYPVIALDLRGHGYSQRGEHVSFYNLDNFVADLAILFDLEKIAHPIIVGHCFGGIVSMVFAARHPDLCQKLVIIDSGYYPPLFFHWKVAALLFGRVILPVVYLVATTNEALSTLRSGYLLPTLRRERNPSEAKNSSLSSPSLRSEYFAKGDKQTKRVDYERYLGTGDFNLPRIFADVKAMGFKNLIATSMALTNMDIRPEIKKIITPTLVVEGTKDKIYPPKIAREIQKMIPGAKLSYIEGANHVLVINNPEEICHLVEDFVGGK